MGKRPRPSTPQQHQQEQEACGGTNTPAIMQYDQFQSVLLLGEADFSFTAAFAKVFGGAITATEFSSGPDLLDLYFHEDHNNNAYANSDDKEEDGAPNPTFLSNLAQRPNVHHVMASVDAKLLGQPNDTSCSRWSSKTQSFCDSIDTVDDEAAKSTSTTNTDNNNNNNHNQLLLFWDCLNRHQTPPIDLIIFNCPHTDKHGKAAKLLKVFFQQVQRCIQQGRMASHTMVELRLRDLRQLPTNKVRVEYQHEEAASASQFELVGVYDNDIPYWETLGYEHKMTRRNATCRGLPCQVWRWNYDNNNKNNGSGSGSGSGSGVL